MDRTRHEDGVTTLSSCHPAFIAGSASVPYSKTPNHLTGSLLQITITDQGFGMTEEEIELALQKHQKIENENSEKFDSFGLGLPMVKRLVELQNGTLDIRSEVGKGSEFVLRFPF